MRSTRMFRVLLFTIILALCGLTYLCHPQPAVSVPKASTMRHYKVINLGTFSILGMNEKGQMVGGTPNALSIQCKPLLWQNGKVSVLGIVPGTRDSYATDINDQGEIVGEVHFTNGNSKALLWKDGKPIELETLGGLHNQAAAINNKGEIAGMAEVPNGDLHAFLYGGGKAHDLGTLGGTTSDSRGINDRGQVVGESTLPSTHALPLGLVHAFLFSNGKMRDLGTLPSYQEGVPNAINDAGEVVGYSDNQSGPRACLWRGGRVLDLGTAGGVYSIAQGINNKGDIVGYSLDKADNMRAFLAANGKTVDLNTLIVSSPGWVITAAEGINDRGEIIGGGKYQGKDFSVLLEPVPEER